MTKDYTACGMDKTAATSTVVNLNAPRSIRCPYCDFTDSSRNVRYGDTLSKVAQELGHLNKAAAMLDSPRVSRIWSPQLMISMWPLVHGLPTESGALQVQHTM
jgi:hypothetical protein